MMSVRGGTSSGKCWVHQRQLIRRRQLRQLQRVVAVGLALDPLPPPRLAVRVGDAHLDAQRLGQVARPSRRCCTPRSPAATAPPSTSRSCTAGGVVAIVSNACPPVAGSLPRFGSKVSSQRGAASSAPAASRKPKQLRSSECNMSRMPRGWSRATRTQMGGTCANRSQRGSVAKVLYFVVPHCWRASREEGTLHTQALLRPMPMQKTARRSTLYSGGPCNWMVLSITP